jgi:tetratricopeptide (TPR) repeat protein
VSDTTVPTEVAGAQGKPEQRFGKYTLVALLGKGGMGEVWKAWDHPLGRWVALKFFVGGASVSDSERFGREAQAVARLSHPHIAAVCDAGELDRRRYIALQYVDGTTLDHATLPIRRACELIRDAAIAIHYAHGEGIVHRDIKPSNLILERGGRVFVLDFGIARHRDAGATLSRTGMVMGTPPFMSPEQAAGDRRLDGRSDVYSLGATLYTLVTGREPFAGRSAEDVITRVVRDDPTAPRKVRPDIPRDVETIVLKCLEKDPGRRYPTAAALADDLRRWLDGEAIVAHPPSVWYLLRKRMAKRRAVVVSVAVTAVAVAAIALATGGVLRGSEFERARAEAGRAHAAGDWARGLSEAERAMAIRRDPSLEALADDCRRQRDRLENRRRLLERLRPVEALIQQTRPLFYVAGIDIRAKLAPVESALDELDRVARDPRYAEFPEAWTALGLGRHLVGDAARAEEALVQAARLAPDDTAVHGALARIYVERVATQSSVSSDGSGGRRPRTCVEAWGRKALDHARRAVREGATGIEEHLAATYRAFAEHENAAVQRLCREGLERYGTEMGTEEYWVLLSLVNPPARDVEFLTQALKRRPHHAWALFLRGNAHFDIEEFDEALADYDAALRANPRLADAYQNRGFIRHHVRDDPSGAMEDYTAVLRLEADNIDAWFNRGNAKKALGEVRGAIEDYTNAIRREPRMTEAYTNRGNAHLSIKETADAIADQDAAIRIDPNYPEAWASRARAHLERGDRAKAIADLKQALAVAPANWRHRAFAEQDLRALQGE